MGIFLRIGLVLALVPALSACLVTPGKFESSLDIRADRRFAFTYKGQVLAFDMDGASTDSLRVESDEAGEATGRAEAVLQNIAFQPQEESAPPAVAEDGGKKDDAARMNAIAAALSKEKGFRSARYVGNKMFEIDYALSGRLSHAFLFPFNIDARLIVPFVAVELRGEDRVRVKAPGYANSSGQAPGIPGSSAGDEAAKALDGIFTLTTDAVIVSQNQEEGATVVPNGRKLVWRITPLTTDAPTAVLKVTQAP